MRTAAILAGILLILGTTVCALLPENARWNAPFAYLVFGTQPEVPVEALGSRIRVPPGFRIGLWADGLPRARMLRFTPAGDLLVSLPKTGQIVLLERDADGDGRPDGRRVLLDGLDHPTGVDLHEGWLYVGEIAALGRVRFDAPARRSEGRYARIATLPEGGSHWTRSVRAGPDGWIYVSTGSSCNVCEERDPRRAAIIRQRPDGSEQHVYASGLRNSVGFAWQPGSGALFATDNGRDFLGDDFPPCELNRVVEGGFYGWPYVNGFGVSDPDYGGRAPVLEARSLDPVHGFRAHTAPLGITFVRGEGLPQAYRGAALVALHGSWNRSRKDGYEVVSLHPPEDGQDGSWDERRFVWGFLEDEDVIGRPVDVAEGPDGAIYVSDDFTGSVYRVAWVGK